MSGGIKDLGGELFPGIGNNEEVIDTDEGSVDGVCGVGDNKTND